MERSFWTAELTAIKQHRLPLMTLWHGITGCYRCLITKSSTHEKAYIVCPELQTTQHEKGRSRADMPHVFKALPEAVKRAYPLLKNMMVQITDWADAVAFRRRVP